MSVINNNGLPPGLTLPSGPPAFTPGAFAAPAPAATSGFADTIQYAPGGPMVPNAPNAGTGAAYGSGFGSTYAQLLAALSNLFTNLGAMFGASPAAGMPSPGTPAPGNEPEGQGQTFFTSATANSVGDPHEAFSGTSASGTAIDQKWNSMIAHPNLLDSNSFQGGYRVSTTVTAPDAKGVTQNASATVTTSGGATSVTMNQDGSYSVSSNGQRLTLPVGQAQMLGNGESVTLNADKSLTVVDANARGGSITTTLKSNGTGGVDVTNSATNVDLGGSLVGHAQYLANGPEPAPSTLGFVDPFASQFPAQLAAASENELALM